MAEGRLLGPELWQKHFVRLQTWDSFRAALFRCCLDVPQKKAVRRGSPAFAAQAAQEGEGMQTLSMDLSAAPQLHRFSRGLKTPKSPCLPLCLVVLYEQPRASRELTQFVALCRPAAGCALLLCTPSPPLVHLFPGDAPFPPTIG